MIPTVLMEEITEKQSQVEAECITTNQSDDQEQESKNDFEKKFNKACEEIRSLKRTINHLQSELRKLSLNHRYQSPFTPVPITTHLHSSPSIDFPESLSKIPLLFVESALPHLRHNLGPNSILLLSKVTHLSLTLKRHLPTVFTALKPSSKVNSIKYSKLQGTKIPTAPATSYSKMMCMTLFSRSAQLSEVVVASQLPETLSRLFPPTTLKQFLSVITPCHAVYHAELIISMALDALAQDILEAQKGNVEPSFRRSCSVLSALLLLSTATDTTHHLLATIHATLVSILSLITFSVRSSTFASTFLNVLSHKRDWSLPFPYSNTFFTETISTLLEPLTAIDSELLDLFSVFLISCDAVVCSTQLNLLSSHPQAFKPKESKPKKRREKKDPEQAQSTPSAQSEPSPQQVNDTPPDLVEPAHEGYSDEQAPPTPPSTTQQPAEEPPTPAPVYVEDRVFVRNIPGDCQEDQLIEHFQQAGTVKSVQCFKTKKVGGPRAGVITFESKEAADKALAELNKTSLLEHILSVERCLKSATTAIVKEKSKSQEPTPAQNAEGPPIQLEQRSINSFIGLITVLDGLLQLTAFVSPEPSHEISQVIDLLDAENRPTIPSEILSRLCLPRAKADPPSPSFMRFVHFALSTFLKLLLPLCSENTKRELQEPFVSPLFYPHQYNPPSSCQIPFTTPLISFLTFRVGEQIPLNISSPINPSTHFIEIQSLAGILSKLENLLQSQT